MELTVDIAILLVLLGMVIFLVDPVKQLNKGKDAQRREDFKQIRNALDTYYNDFSCYPTDVPFGEEWQVEDTLYMKNVPQDPNCNGDNLCYTYSYDETTACPQWNVLFGKLVTAPSQGELVCPLQSECLPMNYSQAGYNFCNFGGDIDCTYLSTTNLAFPIATPTNVPTPTSASSSNLSPTSSQNDPHEAVYFCACGNNHQTVCNITYNPPINVTYYFDAACSNQCGSPC